MRKTNYRRLAAAAALVAAPLLAGSILIAHSQPAPTPLPPPPAPVMPPVLVPGHSVDLMTADGMAAFGAQWKIQEARLVEAPALPNTMPGYDKSFDIAPKAGSTDFDDSKWPVIEPKDLAARRSGGHVAFMWYRSPLTIPAKIGEFDPSGAVAVLSVTVDDYAEVWVNGAIPGRSGYPSPATIQGHNMPQRVVLGTSVKAGDKFQIAVFGINGPISMAPANTVWFREAKMEFYK